MAEIEPKPLEVTRYLEILSFLSEHGLVKEVSVNHILDKYYTYEKYDTESEKEVGIKSLLDKMVSNNHIEKYNTLLVDNHGILESLVYHCSITIEGLIFHIKIQENTSIIATNRALRLSFRTNKNLAVIAITISLLSVIISVLISLWLNKPCH